MVDIHTHILPHMDDGPETMEDSIFMAKIAAESGVDILFATPHCNRKGSFDNYYDLDFEQQYQNFEQRLKEERIPITLLPGMEVYGTEEVPDVLRRGNIITLNHSRYLLLELGFRKDLSLFEFLIDEIKDLGYIPIIAHPERYPYVQKTPDMLNELLNKGCLLQVNKGSILGSFGYRAREIAMILLHHEMVSFVASDAHSPLHRTTDLSIIYDMISRQYSEDYAKLLLNENPGCIVTDREVNSVPAIRRKVYMK